MAVQLLQYSTDNVENNPKVHGLGEKSEGFGVLAPRCERNGVELERSTGLFPGSEGLYRSMAAPPVLN